jgi:DNA primase large subunit
MRVVTKQVDRLPGAETASVEFSRLVTFYRDPPQEELSLDEFEQFAIDRLCLLRSIEQAQIRCTEEAELTKKIDQALNKYMPWKANSSTLAADQRKDVASHFILRLAYCRTEDLRRWLRDTETTLFKHKLRVMNQYPGQMKVFLRSNGIHFDEVDSRL